MTNIQELASTLSSVDIRNITGLSVLSIPDGIMDQTQKEILATYCRDLTEAETARFPADFWNKWESIFDGGDSEPFENADLDMNLYISDAVKVEPEPLKEKEGFVATVVETGKDGSVLIGSPDPEPEKEKEKVVETVAENGKESQPTVPKKKRATRKKADNPAEALFNLIPAERRLDIVLQHVSPDDFGNLTKDQLTAVLIHTMKHSE